MVVVRRKKQKNVRLTQRQEGSTRHNDDRSIDQSMDGWMPIQVLQSKNDDVKSLVLIDFVRIAQTSVVRADSREKWVMSDWILWYYLIAS